MLSRFSSPEDQIEYTDLQPEASSILYHAPNALLSGLFRPFVWEAHTASQWLVAMENLALLVLTIAALTRFKRVIHSQNRLLVFTAIVYIVLLCIFLSLSTPNFGTLSRYKVGFQSFFFLLIACNNPIIDRLKLFIQRLH
jgi:glucan phosphoethanolaminetransferase (alkaline phosphatase superfamily)